MKHCPRCESRKPVTEFGSNRARRDGLGVYCRPCHNDVQRDLERRHRSAALDALGGRCVHCGIDDVRVLCIDHIDGGGTRERRSGRKQTVFYKAVSEDTTGFQALCHNCNWIKRLEHDTPTYVKDSMTFTLTPS